MVGTAPSGIRWLTLAAALLAFAPAPASPPPDDLGLITLGARSFRGDPARFNRRHGHWASNPTAHLVAPVAIPDGVAIARFAAGVTVGSPLHGKAECRLVRESTDGGPAVVLASVRADATGYHRVETTTIDSAPVDTRHFRYYLVVTLESSAFEDPQLFHWIQIEYAAIA